MRLNNKEKGCLSFAPTTCARASFFVSGTRCISHFGCSGYRESGVGKRWAELAMQKHYA
jgi:hypothetical protein